MSKARIMQIKKESKESWREALQQYILFKQAEGLRPSTIKSQKEVIHLLFSRFPSGWTNPKTAVLAFLSEDIKPATYNYRLSYLKSFFSWCIEEGSFSENPVSRFKKRKAEARVVNIEQEALRRLLELPKVNTFAGLRDLGLILLTLDCGIRPKEALALLEDDFNFRSLEVYIRSDVSKTKVSRTLPFMPATAKIINNLIQARHPAWSKNVPVFCSTEGTSLNRHTWGDRLELYGKQLGIKLRPYDLRHCFALYYLRNGGNALALQRTMGHADLSMTKRYVALTQDDIREQHTLASPINILIPKKNRVRNI